jgi:hypothetical protein
VDLQDQITLIANPLPFDKEFRDLKHSQELERKTIIFKDGDDEYANIFLLAVGINGNGWGVGQETFDERADEFLLNPVLVDPEGKVHASNSNGTGKYPLVHILNNQAPLVAGLITQVIKYDTNNDGKNDLARGIMKLEKNKLNMFHTAIKNGINETSPTILPLNMHESAQRLLTYKPLNAVFTKNGAYLEHAKVKALCKGSETSCSNALAASQSANSEKNNVSLIQLLSSNSNMSSNEGSTTATTNQGTGTNTNPNTGQPVINIFGNQTTPSNQPVTKDQEQKPETKAPESTPEQIEIARLQKENKELLTDNVTSLRNEIAPLDLFEGKEEDAKAFHKVLGEDPKQLKWFRDVAKVYVPKMIALYQKDQSGKTETEPKKDEKGNPLAASKVDLPTFNNDTNSGNQDQVFKELNKKSLQELFQMNRKLMRVNPE